MTAAELSASTWLDDLLQTDERQRWLAVMHQHGVPEDLGGNFIEGVQDVSSLIDKIQRCVRNRAAVFLVNALRRLAPPPKVTLPPFQRAWLNVLLRHGATQHRATAFLLGIKGGRLELNEQVRRLIPDDQLANALIREVSARRM